MQIFKLRMAALLAVPSLFHPACANALTGAPHVGTLELQEYCFDFEEKKLAAREALEPRLLKMVNQRHHSRSHTYSRLLSEQENLLVRQQQYRRQVCPRLKLIQERLNNAIKEMKSKNACESTAGLAAQFSSFQSGTQKIHDEMRKKAVEFEEADEKGRDEDRKLTQALLDKGLIDRQEFDALVKEWRFSWSSSTTNRKSPLRRIFITMGEAAGDLIKKQEMFAKSGRDMMAAAATCPSVGAEVPPAAPATKKGPRTGKIRGR